MKNGEAEQIPFEKLVPAPYVPLVPRSVRRVFTRRPTCHAARPVVSCASYVPPALRMNPPRQESCAIGAWLPSCQQTASRTCSPGARPETS